ARAPRGGGGGGKKPQQTVLGWILDPRRLDAAGLEEAEYAAREASILRWFGLAYPGVAGVTIERAAELAEAAAARVVSELRAEIEDPTIGRCRVCGARTAPWAALCDRCFMAPRSPTGAGGDGETQRGYARGQDQLGTGEERHAPSFCIGDGGVPDLRRPTAVHEPRLALDRALVCAAEEVRLQLDGGEAGRALRQVEDAAIAAGGVGEPDDGSRMEVAVRGHVLLRELESRAHHAVTGFVELDSEQPGEAERAHLLQLGERELHGLDPTLGSHGREAHRRQPPRAARVPPLGSRRGGPRARRHGGEVAARRRGDAAAGVRRGARRGGV